MKPPGDPSAEDLEGLEKFLRSRRVGAGPLHTHGIDGLVTAIVIGPDMVMPSQWMPRIWNFREVEFRDEDEGQRVVRTIMGLYQRVASLFADDTSDRFEPLYRRLPEGKERDKAIRDWCEGFIAGLGRHPSMAGKKSREEILEHLWPMVAVNTGGKLATPELIEQIVPKVRTLHAHWLKHRRAVVPGPGTGIGGSPTGPRQAGPTASPTPTPTAGRNDPCPCGSGLKFKKCCGGPGGTVH